MLVIFLWIGASGVFGPLFGKLSTVQENDNSAFLPDSAESTQAAKIIAKFNADANQNLPTLVLYLAEVNPEKIAQLKEHLEQLGPKNISGTDDPISENLTPGAQIYAFPSREEE